MYCEICNKYVVSLGKHLCKCKDHNITPKEYYDKYLKKPNEGICPVCGKETQFIKFSVGYNTHCSQYCTCHDKNVLDKRVDTLITNYGVDSPLKSNEIKNKVFTEEYSKHISECLTLSFSNKSKVFWEERNKKSIQTWRLKYKNKTITNISQIPEIKEKIMDSFNKNVRKKCYVYDDIIFDSSWELAYYIWLKDHNVEFEYHPKINFAYKLANGETKHYFPDFKIGDNYIEIKGDFLLNEGKFKISEEKMNCIKENTILLLKQDLIPVFEYIHKTYGKKYLKQFQKKKMENSNGNFFNK